MALAPGIKYWLLAMPNPIVILAASFSLQQTTLKKGEMV
jgi:hypothetical protein